MELEPIFDPPSSILNNTIAAEGGRGDDGTGKVCLGLLPLGPDPVRSPPLHRTRPPSAATVISSFYGAGL